MTDDEYTIEFPDGTVVTGSDHEHVLALAEWYVSVADDSVTGWGRAFDTGE